MNPDTKFQDAICQQFVWKSPEMLRFAVNLVKEARKAGGVFTADIVPTEQRGTGQGIAGSVMSSLVKAGVIEAVGHKDANGNWFALRRKAARPERNGAWLSVYRLSSNGIADAFLAKHGPVEQQPIQAALFPAITPD
jgi:hypothetical protein